jgi:FkbM family methyltransferase
MGTNFIIWVYTLASGVGKDLHSFIKCHLISENTTVVQIGSNDGVSNDPLNQLVIKNNGWRAIFVEPVPYLFERLKKNYGSDPRFSFENTLINDGSTVKFFFVAQQAEEKLTGLPKWYDQLGGFNRAHILDHLPQLEPFILEKTLQGITIETLFANHDIDHLDLLHVDTEGADFLILSQLNFNKIAPKVIIYEWCHLGRDDIIASFKFLMKCYVLYKFGPDIVAIKRNELKGTNRFRAVIMSHFLLNIFRLRNLKWKFFKI